MPAISFSEGADDAMRHYRWPGNVRQLKNVVEQAALFDAGKEVTDAILRSYLPEISASYIPATTPSAHSYEAEREMLLGMIFKLRQRIDLLQSRLDGDDASSFISRQSILGNDTGEKFPTTLVVRGDEDKEHGCSDVNYSEVIRDSDSPVSLEETEKEMIRKSLERNQGRRKAAAAELQISERTLYRKIKDYGLE